MQRHFGGEIHAVSLLHQHCAPIVEPFAFLLWKDIFISCTSEINLGVPFLKEDIEAQQIRFLYSQNCPVTEMSWPSYAVDMYMVRNTISSRQGHHR
jgi:hypothetical protein